MTDAPPCCGGEGWRWGSPLALDADVDEAVGATGGVEAEGGAGEAGGDLWSAGLTAVGVSGGGGGGGGKEYGSSRVVALGLGQSPGRDPDPEPVDPQPLHPHEAEPLELAERLLDIGVRGAAQ
jgi:hypothetical protein